MAKQLQPRDLDVQRINDVVRELVNGRHNAGGTVTLTAGVTTTVIAHPNCSKDSYVQLTPQTANAAAALATTYVRPIDVLNGQFTITHANVGTTDRSFYYSLAGG